MIKDNAPYAFGAILLGVVGILFGGFAFQWQSVPPGVPAMPWAYVSGALLATGGALIVIRRERWGALLLTAFFATWVLGHVPSTMQGLKHIGAWLGLAETLFLTLGGVALLTSRAGVARRKLALVVRVLAGLCALVFGFAHFNYIKETADMVPGWLPPSREFWAWATGVGHAAAGAALVSGIQARLAAACLAGMMASFVLLVHLPRVLASPTSHFEWAMLGVATTLSGAAWLIRKNAT